jgi:hypothetical protein
MTNAVPQVEPWLFPATPACKFPGLVDGRSVAGRNGEKVL